MVCSESDEDDAPEEAPCLSGAKLEALEEELAAEEDRLQVSATLLGCRVNLSCTRPTLESNSDWKAPMVASMAVHTGGQYTMGSSGSSERREE